MADDKKDDGRGIGGIAGIVPTAYYDLIARICPGVAFWVALSFKDLPFDDAATKELSGASLFVLLILSYLTGIVLTGFSWIWDRLCFYFFTRDVQLSMQLGLHRQDASFATQWTQIARSMDDVTKASGESGKTLVKGLAEVTLCENLLTGLIVLGSLGLVSENCWFFSPLLYWWQYLLTAAALFLSVAFRQMMFVGRVKLLRELHGGEPQRGVEPQHDNAVLVLDHESQHL